MAEISGRQRLDTESKVKLESFNEEEQKLEQWASVFESYANLLGWGPMVEYAMRRMDPVQTALISEEVRAMNANLYRLLALNIPLSIVQLNFSALTL